MSQARSKIAHDILRHLHENPDAADAPEGIAKWWLRDEYQLSEVRLALAELVEDGSIVELSGRDSRPIYRASKAG